MPYADFGLMMLYTFRFHRGGHPPIVRQCFAPDLGAAIRRGNHAVAGYLSDPREAAANTPGRLDIEDEGMRVVARLLFADIARRIGVSAPTPQGS